MILYLFHLKLDNHVMTTKLENNWMIVFINLG